jgi:hypothetical protein
MDFIILQYQNNFHVENLICPDVRTNFKPQFASTNKSIKGQTLLNQMHFITFSRMWNWHYKLYYIRQAYQTDRANFKV